MHRVGFAAYSDDTHQGSEFEFPPDQKLFKLSSSAYMLPEPVP